MTMQTVFAVVGVVAYALTIFGVALRVIWVRRPAGSAYAWILLVVLLPLVGLVLYLLFGERQIGRKRLRRAQRDTRRHREKRGRVAFVQEAKDAAAKVTLHLARRTSRRKLIQGQSRSAGREEVQLVCQPALQR